MSMKIDRRELFSLSLYAVVTLATSRVWSQELANFIIKNAQADPGNFKLIYSNPQLKSEFFLFLKNVYNLYPEDKFHKLINEAASKMKTDQDVYAYILERLSDIKPFLSELTYALPALGHQKKEIADQTMSFLKRRGKIEGYLEIGTPGRYIGTLEDRLSIEGQIFLVNATKPSYSPIDIAERGQLTPIGEFIPLNDYQPILHANLKPNSLDVVTNYIGFHHCPLPKLDAFLKSTADALRKGGSLILRDHDVDSVEMNAIVSLAHDVFNCGLKETWKTNHSELRYFRSLSQWIQILDKHGLKHEGLPLYQTGDPTKNALLEFVKS